MGRRSRTIALRRRRSQLLEELIQAVAARDLLVLDFCREAAIFAETRAYEGSGAANAVEWMTEHCQMTTKDAADSIAIGRRLLSGALTA
jgi:hypothetical protein